MKENMKLFLIPILTAACFVFSQITEAVEEFPWEEMSTAWTWRANTGLLKGEGTAVLQPSPSPKKQNVRLTFPDGGTSLIVAGMGEKMTIPGAPIDEPAWEWQPLGKSTLSPQEVDVLLPKKQTELFRWKGTHTNSEGTPVSYKIMYIHDKLLFGIMSAKRDGISFSRTFTLSR